MAIIVQGRRLNVKVPGCVTKVSNLDESSQPRYSLSCPLAALRFEVAVVVKLQEPIDSLK